MYKIVKKQELTTNIYLMEVEANRVAKTCEPGQFVIVRMDSESERIPLTICDYNREKNSNHCVPDRWCRYKTDGTAFRGRILP